MPRVPQYQPGQVGPVQTTQQRFRAPEGPGAAGIIAAGVQGLADVLSTQDKIDLENDETQSRLAISQARGQYATALDQYKATKLGAARAGQDGFNTSLDQIKKTALESAASPRMRMMMEQGLAEIDGDARRMGASHALGQQQEETRQSFGIEQDSLRDAAVSSDNPAFRDRSSLALRDSVARQLAFDGWDRETSPDAYAIAEKAAVSKLHGGVLDRMFSVSDPQNDEIAEYLTAYRDEMTSDLYTKTLARLQGPIQERMADADADLAFAGIKPSEGAAPVGQEAGPWQGVAVNVANRFGLDPSMVAAVISYETGGTFSPTIMGGKGGQYMGLIQFGPPERKKYGIDKASSPEDWTKAIGDYLQDRGFKKGMGMLDLYSTINAGTPGRYGASDGNGTVQSHVGKILEEHQAKGRNWLGGAGVYDAAPRQWDKAEALSQVRAVGEAQGWTPERTKRAEQVVLKRISTDEGLLSAQRADADEAAANVAATMGDRFRVASIPRSVWSNLSPVQQRQYQDIEKKLLEPTPPSPDGDTVIGLHRMAAGTPADREKFAAFNLAKARAFMTPAEYDELATAQAKMQQDLQSPKARDTYSKIDSAITRAKRWVGVDVDSNKDASEAFRVRRYMEARAAEESAGNKPLTDTDYDRFFRDATRSVWSVNTVWGSHNLRRSSELLSPNFRAQIIRSFQRANGRDPSEAEIQGAWERMGKPGV
jgi:hypothetical protein